MIAVERIPASVFLSAGEAPADLREWCGRQSLRVCLDACPRVDWTMWLTHAAGVHLSTILRACAHLDAVRNPCARYPLAHDALAAVVGVVPFREQIHIRDAAMRGAIFHRFTGAESWARNPAQLAEAAPVIREALTVAGAMLLQSAIGLPAPDMIRLADDGVTCLAEIHGVDLMDVARDLRREIKWQDRRDERAVTSGVAP